MHLPEIKVKLNKDELSQRKSAVTQGGMNADDWTLNRLWMLAKNEANPRQVRLLSQKGDSATFQVTPDQSLMFDLTTAGSLAHALGSMPPASTVIKLFVAGVEVTDTMTTMLVQGNEVELHIGKAKAKKPDLKVVGK
jgi:hypothetical protein